MDRSVCIRDKNDIGNVTQVTFAGCQYKVTTPHGALDPQPTPTMAAAMTQTKQFCYMGFENDKHEPLATLKVSSGPPSLADIRARRAAAANAGGEVEAKGPLKRVAEAGAVAAQKVLDVERAATESRLEALRKRGVPPSLSEVREALESDAPAPAPKMFTAADLSAEDQMQAEALAAVASLEGMAPADDADLEEGLDLDAELTVDIDDDPFLAEDETSQEESTKKLSSLEITELRKMASDSKVKGWQSKTKVELVRALTKR
jgi:hypothetical protein